MGVAACVLWKYKLSSVLFHDNTDIEEVFIHLCFNYDSKLDAYSSINAVERPEIHLDDIVHVLAVLSIAK
jgi:hypothetical protein